jgi:hypothetical protein
VGLSDPFMSVYALNPDNTWVGLPNNQGGQSFICYSLNPNVNYFFGTWTWDPRLPAVLVYGPDNTPLATLNGLNPGVRMPQNGGVSGWHVGPPPAWNFLPR